MKDSQFVRTATIVNDLAYTIHSIFTLQNLDEGKRYLPELQTKSDWDVIPGQILAYYPA